MKFYYDTEFIEAGPKKPIQLISIGIASEAGHTFYAISSEFNPADANPWVKTNVLDKLESVTEVPRQSLEEIGIAIRKFISASSIAAGKDEPPTFFGYYADYDHVCLCQIYGTMMELPNGWPMFTRDLIQTAKEIQARFSVDVIRDIVGQPQGEHNALVDAQWNKKLADALAIYQGLAQSSVATATWPYGTVLPAVVEACTPKTLIVIDGRNQGHVIIGTDHDPALKKGVAGRITFTKGGPTGGYWVFTADAPVAPPEATVAAADPAPATT